MREATIRSLSKSVHKLLLKDFTPSSSTLWFDGAATLQKRFAHQSRGLSSSKARAKFEAVVQEINLLMDSMELSVAPPRSKIRRLVLLINKNLKPKWIGTRTFSRETKDMLVSTLHQEYGWRARVVQGETDVELARKATTGLITIVSRDSDMYFHGAEIFVRFDMKQKVYKMYRLQDILDTLEITQDIWRAAAVVSQNDFDPHLPGQSFYKNLQSIISLSCLDGPGSPETKTPELVHQYCRHFGLDVHFFDKSLDIFYHHHEDADSSALSASNAEIDETVHNLLLRSAKLLNRFKRFSSNSLFNIKPFESPRHYQDLHKNNDPVSAPKKRKTESIIVAPITHQQQSATPTNTGARRKTSVQRDPSGRSSRNIDTITDPSHNNQHRRRSSGRMVKDVMNGRYPMRTIIPGTLRTSLSRGLAAMLPSTNARDRNLICNHIVATMDFLAKANSDLLRVGGEVVFHFIMKMLEKFPSLSPEDVAGRRERFSFLIDEDRKGFFEAIVIGFYRWDSSPYYSQEESRRAGAEAISRYRYLRLEHDPITTRSRFGITAAVLTQISRRLSDSIKSHVFMYGAELKKRVQVWNPAFANSSDGQAMLTSINSQGRSHQHDQVSRHFILNSLLPHPQRLAWLPCRKFTDGFFHITEAQFLASLFIRNSGTSYERGTVLISPDNKELPSLLSEADARTQDTIANQLLDHPPGTPQYTAIKEQFKDHLKGALLTPKDYQLWNTTAPPLTTRKKFMLTGDISTNGVELRVLAFKLVEDKSGGVRQPGAATPGISTTTASLQGGSHKLGNVETEEILASDWAKRLDTTITGSRAAPDPVQGGLENDDDGGVEEILASGWAKRLETTTTRSRAAPDLVRGGLDDIDDGEVERIMESVTLELGSYQPFPRAPLSHTGKKIYLRDVLPDYEAINNLIHPPDGCVIFTLDPGLKNPGTSVAFDSTRPDLAWNVSIPSAPFQTVQDSFNRRQARRRSGIRHVLSSLPLIQTPQIQDSKFIFGWTALRQSLVTRITKGMDVEQQLRSSYGSRSYKRDLKDRSTALRSELDRAASAIIRSAFKVPRNVSKSDRYSMLRKPRALGIGDGEFRSWNGACSFYSRLIEALV
ncbi:hypothetical protein BGW39_002056 [Mortierella sp. 14UC]|nr:hypothetical protein BGW39_002056 [Mortierella sp. 14UC]